MSCTLAHRTCNLADTVALFAQLVVRGDLVALQGLHIDAINPACCPALTFFQVLPIYPEFCVDVARRFE